MSVHKERLHFHLHLTSSANLSTILEFAINGFQAWQERMRPLSVYCGRKRITDKVLFAFCEPMMDTNLPAERDVLLRLPKTPDDIDKGECCCPKKADGPDTLSSFCICS